MSEQTTYFWAVVGKGNPEPVAVDGEPGSLRAYTIGCPDPYLLDDPACPCRLLPTVEQAVRDNRYIAKIKDGPPEPIEVPENTLSRKVRRDLEARFAAKLAPRHSYAGFGRRGSGCLR
jgi:hypothetical protein